MTGAGERPSWSAVMPVYNEERDVLASVARLRAEFDAAGLQDAQIVVVDDGSTDATPLLLGASTVPGLETIRQANEGRFAARRSGLSAARGDMVLLVDCGVEIAPGALGFLAEQVSAHPDRLVWNADVEVATAGSAPAALWKVLTSVAWHRYFASPRLLSYGLEEFDRYPKGTTLFAAPRRRLIEACEEYACTIGDPRRGSDDTAVIRELLGHTGRIWMAPAFSCVYSPRTRWRPFAAHARARGTTFVDGYLRAPGPVGRLLRTAAVAAPVTLVGGGVALLAHPALMLAVSATAIVCGTAVVGSAARRCGCSRSDVLGFVRAAPVFALAFGLGTARGLRLSVAHTIRQRSRGGR